MGWMYRYGRENPTGFFRDLLTWEDENVAYRCLDVAVVELRAAYAAVEREIRATGEREVLCATYLVDQNRYKDGCGFGYKDVPEADAPEKCPERILDLLTPTDDPRAQEWRRRNRERIARRRATRVRVGDLVRFARPIRFTDGSQLSLFRLAPRNVFEAVTEDGDVTGSFFRVSKWRDREFERVPSEWLEAARRERERRTELTLRWNEGGREPLLLRDEALDDGRAARLVFDPAAGPPPGEDDRMPWFVAVDGEERSRRFRTEREAQAEVDALVVRFGLGGGPRAPR